MQRKSELKGAWYAAERARRAFNCNLSIKRDYSTTHEHICAYMYIAYICMCARFLVNSF